MQYVLSQLRRPIELKFLQFVYVMHIPTSENTGFCQKRCPVPLCILLILTEALVIIFVVLLWNYARNDHNDHNVMYRFIMCGDAIYTAGVPWKSASEILSSITNY